jgi:DNA-binding XRE family transcriptional regulator
MDVPVNRIRALRENLGIKRVAFAAKLGVSLKHVYTVECGRANPSIPLILKIRDELGCSLDDIYPGGKRRHVACA